jgi:hypothetical protein
MRNAVLLAALAFAVVSGLSACLNFPARAGTPGAELRLPVEEEALTDMRPDAGDASHVVPPKPEPWMKKPPCETALEEYPINGACWQATARKPPCGALWQHGDVCYRAIKPATREPTSVKP